MFPSDDGFASEIKSLNLSFVFKVAVHRWPNEMKYQEVIYHSGGSISGTYKWSLSFNECRLSYGDTQRTWRPSNPI